MRFIISVLLIVFLYSIHAQENKTNYINRILEICPDADIIEVETKDDYVEIEYLCNDKIFETGLTFDLKIIYTETETEIDGKILHKIESKLDKEYFGWTIDEFSLVKMPDTSFYKAEILHDGIEENIYFTLDGKYFKAKNMVLQEAWNIASLESNPHYKKSAYYLTRPDETYDLPEILVEISGIAVLNDSEIFCIQDEAGIVFRYNLQKRELTNMHRFTDKGDFEDITVQDNMVHILRSDGTVFGMNHIDYKGITDSRIIPLSCMDIEGLFYENSRKRFLIACKDKSINQKSSLRHIYSLGTNFSSEPEIALSIDLKEINTFFNKQYGDFNTKTITFNPSSISVHPISGEIFILSASNRLLAIYSDNRLKNIYPLAEELFYKPEGIGFSSNGDMYISSEGNKKGYIGGQIHYFKMNP